MSGSSLKKLFSFLFPFLIFAGFAIVSSLLETSDIQINEYSAIIHLNEQGDMHVVERWDMHYKGDYNVRFRDIGYDKYPDHYPLVSSDTNVATFDEDSVLVKVYKNGNEVTDQVRLGYSFLFDRDELGEIITCDPYTLHCASLFVDFTPVGGMNGDIIFEYDYTIIGAMTSYLDSSEINWKLFDYMEADINRVTLNLHVPANTFDETDFYLFSHGREDAVIEKISNQEFRLSMEHIDENEFLEFRLLSPRNLFDQIPLSNHVNDSRMTLENLLEYEENLKTYYQTGDQIHVVLHDHVITLGFVMLFLGVVAYIFYDREYPKAYQNRYLQDLPSHDAPAQIGYLMRMKKIDDVDLTATLLDLIRRGYITIDQYETLSSDTKADLILERNSSKSQVDLLPHESFLLTWFFDHIGNGKSVSTEQIQNFGKKNYNQAQMFQRDARLFVKAIKESVKDKDYFENYHHQPGKKIMMFLVIIPILYAIVSTILGIRYDIEFTLPFLVSLAIAISYILYIIGIKRRSKNGHELYQQWTAFKSYLNDFDGLKDFSIPSVETWHHYLVYATTFKIADKVMNQLRIRLPQTEQENSSYHMMYSRYHLISYHINKSYRIGKDNTSKTISQHRSSSSGSGGSSGGGSGGGRSR